MRRETAELGAARRARGAGDRRARARPARAARVARVRLARRCARRAICVARRVRAGRPRGVHARTLHEGRRSDAPRLARLRERGRAACSTSARSSARAATRAEVRAGRSEPTPGRQYATQLSHPHIRATPRLITRARSAGARTRSPAPARSPRRRCAPHGATSRARARRRSATRSLPPPLSATATTPQPPSAITRTLTASCPGPRAPIARTSRRAARPAARACPACRGRRRVAEVEQQLDPAGSSDCSRAAGRDRPRPTDRTSRARRRASARSSSSRRRASCVASRYAAARSWRSACSDRHGYGVGPVEVATWRSS